MVHDKLEGKNWSFVPNSLSSDLHQQPWYRSQKSGLLPLLHCWCWASVSSFASWGDKMTGPSQHGQLASVWVFWKNGSLRQLAGAMGLSPKPPHQVGCSKESKSWGKSARQTQTFIGKSTQKKFVRSGKSHSLSSDMWTHCFCERLRQRKHHPKTAAPYRGPSCDNLIKWGPSLHLTDPEAMLLASHRSWVPPISPVQTNFSYPSW